MALWLGCKPSSVLPGKKDSQSFWPAVLLVKYTPVLRPIYTVCMLELEEIKFATKFHQNPPVFARKRQNEVAQAQTPGAEARISPLGPAPVVQWCPAAN